MTLTLNDLGAEWVALQRAITRAIDDADGEITDEVELMDQHLDEIQGDFKAKLAGTCHVRSNLMAEVDALKAEKKRLAQRLDARINGRLRDVAKLEKRMTFWMDELELEKLDTQHHRVSFRKSSSVAIDDLDALPEQFRRVKVEADKAALKQALKSGPVEGCHLETKKGIQIK